MSLSVSALGQEKVNNQTDQTSKEQMEEEGDIKPVWHCVQTPHTADTDPDAASSWSRNAELCFPSVAVHSGWLYKRNTTHMTND